MSSVAFSGGRMSLRYAPGAQQTHRAREPAGRASPPRARSTTTASTSDRATSRQAATIPAVGWKDSLDEPSQETKRELRQVRSLFLCCQNIVSIQHIAHLGEMTGLRSLSLHMNLIRRIEGLDSLRQLVELDLSGNEIRTLDGHCFRPLAHLARLNLSSNYLAELPDGAFTFLPALSWLSVAHNALTHVAAGLASVPRSAPLAYVDVCGNNIEELDEVLSGLAGHREHLRELRLQTPRTLVSSSATMPAGVAAGTGTDTEARAGVAMSVLNPFATPAVRENPFCSRVYVIAGPEGEVHTTHVERALRAFPRLAVLDGVSFRVDTLSAMRRQHVEPAERAGEGARPREGSAHPARGAAGAPGESAAAAAEEEAAAVLALPQPARKLSFREVSRVDDVRRLDKGDPSDRSTDTSASDTDPPRRSRRGSHRRRHRHSRSGSCRRSGSTAAAPAVVSPATSSAAGLSPSTLVEGGEAHARRPPPAAAGETPSYRLQWRSTRVSRGTCTSCDVLECPEGLGISRDGGPAAVAGSAATLTRQLERAHAQLQLRVATEAGLRRELEEQRQRTAELEVARAAQRSQEEHRVDALKRELVRRAEEVAIMRRKERASLVEQANAADAHWRGVLAAQEAAWRAQQSEQVAATRAAAQAELDDWKREYQQLRERCEGAVMELTEVQHARARERRRLADHTRDQVAVLLAEQDARHALELAALAVGSHPGPDAALALHTERAAAERASLIEEWTQYRETWEAHAQNLQTHYRGVLRQAEVEAARLQEQIDAVKADLRRPPRTDAQTSTEKAAGTDASTQTSSAGDGPATGVQQQQQQQQQPSPHAAVHTAGRDHASREAPPADGARAYHSDRPPPTTYDSLDVAANYWRGLADRRGGEAARLQAALAASEEAAAVLSREHARILSALRGYEAKYGAGEAAGLDSDGWATERTNLMRTLRNLEADLAKKNDALDALEAEAREKISQKRIRIAELEERVEALQASHEKATATTAACRDELTQRQAELAKAADQLREQKSVSAERAAYVKDLEARLASLSQRLEEQQRQQLATVDRQRHEREAARLVSALTVAREQLVRLHASHCELSRERDALAASVSAKDTELAEATRRLAALQESSRLKQQATLDALTRLMLTDSV